MMLKSTYQPHHYRQHSQQTLPRHQQTWLDGSSFLTSFDVESHSTSNEIGNRISSDKTISDSNRINNSDDNNRHRVSSLPLSTQSLLSEYSDIQPSPLSTFDSVPAIVVPRGAHADTSSLLASIAAREALPSSPSDPENPIFASTAADLMQPDSWLGSGVVASLPPTKSSGRFSHQRESSLSSLGSAGPASPYSQSTTNPQIAVTESGVDGLHGLSSNDDFVAYQLAKSFNDTQEGAFYANYPNYASADAGALTSLSEMAGSSRSKSARTHFPPPLNHMAGASRSRPVSVASSVASDSPATPVGEPDHDGGRRYGLPSIPKLDRTMTDVYSDELYSPNFTVASASSTQVPMSPNNNVFAQRLQAANTQHLSAAQSPVSTTSRDRSPFRHGSPLAPTPTAHEFNAPLAPGSSNVRYPSAQQIREQRKAALDAQAVSQQLARASDTGTPQTISPKDAVLDFHGSEADAKFGPLFPDQESDDAFVANHAPKSRDANADAHDNARAGQAVDSLSLQRSALENYITPQLPSDMHLPQQYPFISQQSRHQGSVISGNSHDSEPSSRMSSTASGNMDLRRGNDGGEGGDNSSSGSRSSSNSPQRPAATGADGGTYTCTYHGCTQRFETPVLLQKHKREGHRQIHSLGAARRPDSIGGAGMTSSLVNSQAGPHRCDRINPSTGKPCNTVFSRPYDLTRHEDTIHNARKQKVRCDLCTDEKTFSRADALTRHYRVCHPDVEFPGKHRETRRSRCVRRLANQLHALWKCGQTT